jgi:hypothetical protein
MTLIIVYIIITGMNVYSSTMRLSTFCGLHRDTEQFIYNWLPTPEDDLVLDEDTGRKLNGREEKRTSLAVMLDQGLAKKTQAS